MDQVTFPIRVFTLLGVDTVVCECKIGLCVLLTERHTNDNMWLAVTNAAGGLNPEYCVGDIVLLNDARRFLHLTPETGLLTIPSIYSWRAWLEPILSEDPMQTNLGCASHPYPMHTTWSSVATYIRHGKKTSPPKVRDDCMRVYMPSSGAPREWTTSGPFMCPSFQQLTGCRYETRAESRMLRMLGGDVVGMSTVPEIVVARHCGLRVMAFSLVTNNAVLAPVPGGDEHLLQSKAAAELNAILEEGKAGHEEVLEAGRTAALDMQVCRLARDT